MSKFFPLFIYVLSGKQLKKSKVIRNRCWFSGLIFTPEMPKAPPRNRRDRESGQVWPIYIEAREKAPKTSPKKCLGTSIFGRKVLSRGTSIPGTDPSPG